MEQERNGEHEWHPTKKKRMMRPDAVHENERMGHERQPELQRVLVPILRSVRCEVRAVEIVQL